MHSVGPLPKRSLRICNGYYTYRIVAHGVAPRESAGLLAMERTLRELPALGGFVIKLLADAWYVKLPTAMIAAAVGYALPTESMQRTGLAATGLVILDTITGIVASANGGEPISSAKMGRVLVKMLAYFSVLEVAAAVHDSIPGAKEFQGASVTIVLCWIVLTEGISVLENVHRMGFEIPLGLDKWLKERMPAEPRNKHK